MSNPYKWGYHYRSTSLFNIACKVLYVVMFTCSRNRSVSFAFPDCTGKRSEWISYWAGKRLESLFAIDGTESLQVVYRNRPAIWCNSVHDVDIRWVDTKSFRKIYFANDLLTSTFSDGAYPRRWNDELNDKWYSGWLGYDVGMNDITPSSKILNEILVYGTRRRGRVQLWWKSQVESHLISLFLSNGVK